MFSPGSESAGSSKSSPEKFNRIIMSSSSRGNVDNSIQSGSPSNHFFNNQHEVSPVSTNISHSKGHSSPEQIIRKGFSVSVSIPPIESYQHNIINDVISQNENVNKKSPPKRSPIEKHNPVLFSDGNVFDLNEAGKPTQRQIQQRRDSDLSLTEISDCLKSLAENPSYRNCNYFDDLSVPSTDTFHATSEKRPRPISFPIARTGSLSADASPRGAPTLFEQLGAIDANNRVAKPPSTEVSPHRKISQYPGFNINVNESNTYEYQDNANEYGYSNGGGYTSTSSKSVGMLDLEGSRSRVNSGYSHQDQYFTPASPFDSPETTHQPIVGDRGTSPAFSGVPDGRYIFNKQYNGASGGYSGGYDTPTTGYESASQMGTNSRPLSGAFGQEDYGDSGNTRGHDSQSSRSLSGSYLTSVENLSPVVSGFDGYVYKVQFKRSHRNFLRSAQVDKPIRIGDFVIVEADRGEDLGVVCEVQPMPAFFREGGSLFARDSKTSAWGDRKSGVKHIIRHALPQEYSLLPVKMAEEQSIVEICREQCKGYLLPMLVVDSEYQYDRHKLTIYYESNSRRIDFRELVRDLFSMYKTRIWMEAVSYSFRPLDFAIRALSSGVYVTPGPCPPSPTHSHSGVNQTTHAPPPLYPSSPTFSAHSSKHLSMHSSPNHSAHSSKHFSFGNTNASGYGPSSSVSSPIGTPSHLSRDLNPQEVLSLQTNVNPSNLSPTFEDNLSTSVSPAVTLTAPFSPMGEGSVATPYSGSPGNVLTGSPLTGTGLAVNAPVFRPATEQQKQQQVLLRQRQQQERLFRPNASGLTRPQSAVNQSGESADVVGQLWQQTQY